MKRGVLAALVLAGAELVACMGKKPAEGPAPDATRGGSMTAPPESGPSPSPSASSSAPPPPSATTPLTTLQTTDPNELAQIFTGAAAAANASLQPPATAQPGDDALAKLKAVAKKQAPGMKPEGPSAKGMLQQGGHLVMTVTLQGGKCYAIVGYSPAGGVKDLDLHLLAPTFYTSLVGQDATDDNTPVIGKASAPMCPILPAPIAYKLDIYARKGAGAVEVQVYSKSNK